MAVKEYFLPQSVAEAADLVSEYGPALLVMAGGTLAMPLINNGISMPDYVMGLRRAGLDYVQRIDGSLAIGATATLTRIIGENPIPMLTQAAHQIGGWAIRNMATAGGNLFAPPPSGDFAVALLALDAQLRVVSKGSERRLTLSEFYTGFMTSALQPGELIAEILIPMPKGAMSYVKYGRRQANTPSVVTVAAQIVLDGSAVIDARIALNAVGPHPFRARHAEAALIGADLDDDSIANAAEAAANECEPFTDAIASEWYRRKMVGVYVRRALEQIA